MAKQIVEPDERFVHRLEAFSDIVIGFSLAQLGLNLVIPQHAAYVFTQPVALIAFLLTFTILAGIWYSHHRLFADYFVPSWPMVLLNFTMLAGTLLLVYMLQVYVHFFDSPADAHVAGSAYLVAFAIVYALLAALFALGLRTRWEELDTPRRRYGVSSAMRLAGLSLAALAGTVVTVAYGMPIVAAFSFVPVGALLGRAAAARVNARVA